MLAKHLPHICLICLTKYGNIREFIEKPEKNFKRFCDLYGKAHKVAE